MARVLQQVHIRYTVMHQRACTEDIFRQLQYVKLIAHAETLAGPERLSTA